MVSRPGHPKGERGPESRRYPEPNWFHLPLILFAHDNGCEERMLKS